MDILQISLLGSIRIAHDGQPAAVKMTRKIQALLAFLVLHRQRSYPREVVASLFWADYSQKRALNCLSTALWRLRRVLEPRDIPRGTYIVTAPPAEVGFNPQSEHWLDVAAFEEQVARVLAMPIPAVEDTDAQALERAVRLYAGDLLEGFYDDWVLQEQERLRRLYLDALAYLMGYYRRHAAFAESLACGERILRLDPLREEIHREMMRLYLDNGQRAHAAQQYEHCRQALAEELGMTPMEETQAVFAQIARTGCAGRIPAAPGAPSNLQQTLQELRLDLRRLDEARSHLHQAIQLVEQFTE